MGRFGFAINAITVILIIFFNILFVSHGGPKAVRAVDSQITPTVLPIRFSSLRPLAHELQVRSLLLTCLDF